MRLRLISERHDYNSSSERNSFGSLSQRTGNPIPIHPEPTVATSDHNFNVRYFRSEDLQGIVNIIQQSHPQFTAEYVVEWLRKEGRKPNAVIMVAAAEKLPVGFMIYYLHQDRFEIRIIRALRGERQPVLEAMLDKLIKKLGSKYKKVTFVLPADIGIKFGPFFNQYGLAAREVGKNFEFSAVAPTE